MGRLILGRFEGEAIQIGDDITVYIDEVRRATKFVKVRIEAPRDIGIQRINNRKDQPPLPPPPQKLSLAERLAAKKPPADVPPLPGA